MLVLAAGLLAAGVGQAQVPPEGAGRRLELRLKPLPPGVRAVALETDASGRSVVVLQRSDGGEQRVSPDDLAGRLLDEGRPRGFLYRLFNITSPVGMLWVGLGFLGQILFTGRMLLQWLVSEREKRSVAPVGFWWDEPDRGLDAAPLLRVETGHRRNRRSVRRLGGLRPQAVSIYRERRATVAA